MKITLLLSSALLACSLTVADAFADGFSDVSAASPYQAFIQDLKTAGVVSGFEPDLFKPEQPLTRAEFAKIATAAFGLKDTGAPAPFQDIQDHWAAPYIRAAYQAGIVNGTSAGFYSPDRPVKREEAAVMVWRFAQSHGLSVGPPVPFREKPDLWAAEAVGSVIAHRWFGPDAIQTDAGWSYRPLEVMKRQEMAGLIDLAMKELSAGQPAASAAEPGPAPASAPVPEAAPAATPAVESRPLYKATYLWRTQALLQNQAEVLQFLQKNRVNLVFLQIDVDVPANRYSDFIKAAGAQGIEVHALGGAPDWILPDNRPKMYSWIDWVKTYNKSVPASDQFKGLHLDVEPFTLPNWEEDIDTNLGYWRDTVSGFAEQSKSVSPLMVAGADMPFWLDKFKAPDGEGGTVSLSDWMFRRLDLAALMAYRDNAANILGCIATEMAAADRAGKPVLVVVETQPSNEGAITFYDKGQDQMMRELGKVEDNLKSHSVYKGVAIHEYDSWIALKP